MAVGYLGVVSNGRIMLDDGMHLPEGMRVMVLPQDDPEDEWLSVTEAAERYEVPVELVQRWVKSGRVRILSDDSSLVNASDVEEAADVHLLAAMSLEKAFRDEE